MGIFDEKRKRFLCPTPTIFANFEAGVGAWSDITHWMPLPETPRIEEDVVLEDEIAKYLNTYRTSISMTNHRMARHIIEFIKSDGNNPIGTL